MIDHDIEKDLTAETEHGHGCWEVFAEKMAETHGLDGRHDDELDGLTLWMHYEEFITGGGCEEQAGCPVEEEQE